MAMSARAGGVIRPGDADAEMASRAARRISDYLLAHPGTEPVRIRGELAGDDALVVPRTAAVVFAQILALLATGQGVEVIPDSAELTTQQAADFLNVSRPYLIRLLEADEIPYRKVGTHRRIRFEDLREYRRRDDLKRRQAADGLTQLSEELGLY
jgi:excisionase family DNA binding protein